MGRREASIRLTYLSARALCHATESPEKVRSALRILIPEDHELSESAASGYYGNPILIIEGRLEIAREIRDVLAKLPPDLEARPAPRGSAFVMKLDKAAALSGRFVPGIHDPIHVRVGVDVWGGPPEWKKMVNDLKKRAMKGT